jgi:hypothetical protein
MSNGFIRHKKVEWVFQDKNELFSYTPRTEGVYALDNYYGDIYLWNGDNWILYAKDAVMAERLKRPQPDNWKRLNDLPTFSSRYTSSNTVASGAGFFATRWTGSLGSFACNVDIYPGNFTENINVYDDRSFVGTKSFMSASVFIYNEGMYVTASAVNTLPPPSGSTSGSFYTVVSLSLA